MHVGLVGILYESGLQRAKVPHICCAMILSDTDTQVEWALPIIMRKEKIQGNITSQENSYLLAKLIRILKIPSYINHKKQD